MHKILEFDGSFLKESLDSVPENDTNTFNTLGSVSMVGFCSLHKFLNFSVFGPIFVGAGMPANNPLF